MIKLSRAQPGTVLSFMCKCDLCGAIVARLLHHVSETLKIPSSNIFTSTDSSVVLSWIQGYLKQFKSFVANRVAEIMELVPQIDGGTFPELATLQIAPREDYIHQSWPTITYGGMDPASYTNQN